MSAILLPCTVHYEQGPDRRPRIVAIDANNPIFVESARFDGDTFVVMDGEAEAERWDRSKHWCVFPAMCWSCGGVLAPVVPIQFRRLMLATPELNSNCAHT